MNKLLFLFLAFILLNQGLAEGEGEQNNEGENEDDPCSSLDSQNCADKLSTDGTLIICALTQESTKCEKVNSYANCKAAETSDLSDEQCSKLSTGNKFCVKGPSGCQEVADCDSITFAVEENVCEHVLADYDSKCELNDSNGCKATKKKCVISEGTNEYTYSNDICSKLDTTGGEGYICYSNGQACIETNECDQIKNTIYASDSKDLSDLCAKINSNCVPDGTGCKTKTEPSQPDDTEDKCSEYKSSETCKNIIEDGNKLIQCIWKEGDANKCQVAAKYETCSSAVSLTGVTDAQCSKLSHSEGNECIGGPSGCIEASDCNSINVKVEQSTCQRIKSKNDYETCSKKSDDTGCELIPKSCTAQLNNPSKEICAKLTPSKDSKCYFTGTECKEAKNCLGVTETTLSDTDLDEVCLLFGEKCLRDNKKCKMGSICLGKDKENCGLILESNILFDCEYDETKSACEEKSRYETCDSAKKLTGVTLEECKDLFVEAYQKCILGDSGCKVETRACSDTDIESNINICSQLAPSEGKTCYFSGTNCLEADSCEDVLETSLGEAELTEVCKSFSITGKQCVPDGKKCKSVESKEGNDNGNNSKWLQSMTLISLILILIF